jgi:HD superfamily phosphohydrolase YqeK
MKPIYQKIFERAKPFLRTRKNLIHTRTALQYAFKLLNHEKGEEEIVIPASILHDVGWKMIPAHLHLTAFGPNPSNPKLARVHEVEGARIARIILEELHYPPEKTKEICRIIRGHDSRKRPISQSDRIVKDADKLTRYSREGMAISSDWFRIPRRIHLDFLEEQIGRWFFLATARNLARAEMDRRKKKRKGNVTPALLSDDTNTRRRSSQIGGR